MTSVPRKNNIVEAVSSGDNNKLPYYDPYHDVSGTRVKVERGAADDFGSLVERIPTHRHYSSFKEMKSHYIEWIGKLKRIESPKYVDQVRRLVSQGVAEISYFADKSKFQQLTNERFIEIDEFDKGHGLNNIRVMLSLAVMYGAFLNRTVLLPPSLQRDASRLVERGVATNSTATSLDPQLSVEAVFDIDETNERASRWMKSSRVKVHGRTSDRIPKYMESTSSSGGLSAVAFDEGTVYGSDTRSFWTWRDDELVELLRGFEGIRLKLPYFFCDDTSEWSWKERMEANDVWVFSKQIRERGDKVLEGIQTKAKQQQLQKKAQKEKETTATTTKEKIMNDDDRVKFGSVHARVEEVYPVVCSLYTGTPMEFNSKGAYPNSFYPRFTSCCYTNIEIVASKLLRHNRDMRLKYGNNHEDLEDINVDRFIPLNLFIAGGHSNNPYVRKVFRKAGFVVHSKENYLSKEELWNETSNNNLNFLLTALDYYIASKADVFVGTSWSSFSFNIASQRYLAAIHSLENQTVPINPSKTTLRYDTRPCDEEAIKNIEKPQEEPALSSFCWEYEMNGRAGQTMGNRFTRKDIEFLSCFYSCW